MIHPKFIGTIQNGTLTLENPDRFKKYLSSLKAKKVSMTGKPHRKIRTTGKIDEPGNQNGYLWGAVYPVLCDYFGYNPDEMHQAIKHKFLRIGGTDELPKIKSTSKLSRIEWEKLMKKIRVWALTDYEINIPTVEDYYNGAEIY